MGASIPLLAVDGFVTNGNDIMVKLYEHFKSSDNSQSNFYQGKVMSLKYILHNYKDESKIKSTIEESLNILYSNYFETVDLYVVITTTDSSYNISVDITVIDSNGIKYVLSTATEIVKNNLTTFDTQQELLRS